MSPLILSVKNITKSYGSSKLNLFKRMLDVLKGVSFEVNHGEIVGIVGENGSGKSTLMKIIAGILKPDSGSIKKNGKIGYCPQQIILFDKLTVKETFRYFGEAYSKEKNEIESSMEKYLKILNFEKYRDFLVENLSEGTKQKLNLSIALMHDPDLLLLDEPYTGFDYETYLKFWEITEDIVKNGDKSILIISHLLHEKKRFDKILKIINGRFVREK